MTRPWEFSESGNRPPAGSFGLGWDLVLCQGGCFLRAGAATTMRKLCGGACAKRLGCDWRLTESLLQLLAAGVNIPDAALADSV